MVGWERSGDRAKGGQDGEGRRRGGEKEKGRGSRKKGKGRKWRREQRREEG